MVSYLYIVYVFDIILFLPKILRMYGIFTGLQMATWWTMGPWTMEYIWDHYPPEV